MKTDKFDRVCLSILAMIFITICVAISCSYNVVKKPEAESPPAHIIKEVASDGISIRIYEIDGCQYAVFYEIGVVHLETCPNPIHKKQ